MEKQPPKITYLFGAGASAQVMPTIKEMRERIKFVRDFIEKNYIYEDGEELIINEHKFKKNDAKLYLLEGLEKLYEYSSKHSTVDTYAKRLYINNNRQQAAELNFFLALYFNIEQKIVGVDPRYDTFFISTLNQDGYNFPNNLKFLSWNYDLQMEAAYRNIVNQDNNFLKFNYEYKKFKKDEFTSIKLNGSCNFSQHSDLFPLNKGILSDGISSKDLDFSLGYGYLQLKNKAKIYDNGRIDINFAWYRDWSFISKVAENYDQTEILVVIGYSFPFFNREVDRKIIRSMENLRKIYIQDRRPKDIESRFLSILPDWKERNINIIPVEDVNEFFLPPEL